MVDIVVAKLQNRRGLRKDLPQPLSPGEFGLCLDTAQLFIGADADDPNSITALVIELITPTSATQNLANQIIQTQLIQYDFTTETLTTYDPMSPSYVPNALSDKKDALQIILADDAGFSGNARFTQVTIVAYEVGTVPDAGFDDAIIWNFRGYVVYDAALTLPAPVAGTTNAFFSDVSGILFDQGLMDLDTSGVAYVGGDAGAVSGLILEVDGTTTGLVNVVQNIEVYTDHTDIASFVFERVPYTLPVSDGVWVPVAGATLDLTSEDAFLMEYSLKDETGGSVGSPATYSRTGTMQVVTDGDTITFLNDTFAELTASAGMTVDFQMSGATANVLQLQYKTAGTPPTLSLVISTIGWKSF